MAGGKIPANHLTADLVTNLRNLNDAKLNKRIEQVWGIVRSSPADKKKLIEDYKRLLAVSPTLARSASEGNASGNLNPYQVASRLSFGTWDSIPDEKLLIAASAGELKTREQIAAEAERILDDPRTRSKIREFLLQWLKVDQPPEIAKDKTRFPEFTPEVAHDLRCAGYDRGIEVLICVELSQARFINQKQPIEHAVLAHQILRRRDLRLLFGTLLFFAGHHDGRRQDRSGRDHRNGSAFEKLTLFYFDWNWYRGLP